MNLNAVSRRACKNSVKGVACALLLHGVLVPTTAQPPFVLNDQSVLFLSCLGRPFKSKPFCHPLNLSKVLSKVTPLLPFVLAC